MHSPRYSSAEEAISAIKPGSVILLGESCGEPLTLVEAMVEDRERLKGSRIVESRRIPGAAYAQLYDYFNIVTFHVTSDHRKMIGNGKVEFIPVKLTELYTLFKPDGVMPVDVALIQVSPPDSRGQCSLGVVAGYTRYAALNAKMVIAEVNEKMPRTFGENQLHIDSFDYVVETSRPLLEYPPSRVSEEDMAVADNVSRLISDGSVLSLGIGGIPEGVVKSLMGKKNLGLHSGMISDGIIPLIEKKVINNSRKTIDKGKNIVGVVMGTEKLFQFVNNNPEIEVHPYSYTHNINTLAKIDNFVCVNSAVEVDLTGQVNAESVAGKQLSTIGGQADFVRGALMSKGGKAIFAIPSTARNGKSKIVPRLSDGAIVSTPRYDVQYVVTEYGIAELWGKTLSQRMDALISIAHPSCRDELSKTKNFHRG